MVRPDFLTDDRYRSSTPRARSASPASRLNFTIEKQESSCRNFSFRSCLQIHMELYQGNLLTEGLIVSCRTTKCYSHPWSSVDVNLMPLTYSTPILKAIMYILEATTVLDIT